MIRKEHLLEGIISYFDDDVLPKLPTSGKWILGSMITIALPKADALAESLINNPMIQALDVVSEDGMIDDVKLMTALMDSARKYGAMELSVPIVGTMRFTYNDIQSLSEHLHHH